MTLNRQITECGPFCNSEEGQHRRLEEAMGYTGANAQAGK